MLEQGHSCQGSMPPRTVFPVVLHLPIETVLRAALSLRLSPPFPSFFPLSMHRFQMNSALQRPSLPPHSHSSLSVTGVYPSESLGIYILASTPTEHELTISSRGRLTKQAGRWDLGTGSSTLCLAKESTSQVLCGVWAVPAQGVGQLLKILLVMMR